MGFFKDDRRNSVYRQPPPEKAVMSQYPIESIEDRTINYTIEANGQIYLIEHVPARVCIETGEQLFSPETVERIQDIIEQRPIPNRIVETPVYDFAA